MKFSWVSILLGFLTAGSFAAMEFKEAEITTLKNLVEHDPGTGAAPAKVNEKIREKSKVSTAAASMAELTFADSSITRMGANTQFSFQSKERLVKLDQGTVLIHTPPGNGGAVVEAGGVTAAVSGTTFMASRDVSGNTMFVLLEGQGGLKITVGGSSTVIRPGQAASVGAETIQEAKSSGSADATPGGGKPGTTTAAADDQKPGGSGQGPAAAGGGEGGGGTPSAGAPKIQVFDVDVKKVVATTPLIVEFKNELPSAAKIEKTVEIQQTAVKEGKLEKLEVEVVAVKSKDGDLLVGAPRVEKEEMVVVNKKTEVVGRGGPADNLDIDTAAGPGAGGPAPDARPAPAPAAVAQTPSAPSTPSPSTSVNVVSQVASSTAGSVRPSPTSLDFTVSSGGVARATLDRATTQAAPVGLSVSSIPGLNLSPNSTTIPANAATSGDFALSLANPRAYFPGWDSAYNLNPLVLTATAGSFSDSVTTSALWPTAAIERANPVRDFAVAEDAQRFSWSAVPGATSYKLDFGANRNVWLTANSYLAGADLGSATLQAYDFDSAGQWIAVGAAQSLTGNLVSDDASPAELAALDSYFYFTARAPGVAGGPTAFFADAPAQRSLNSSPGNDISLGIPGQDFEFYTAGTWTLGVGSVSPISGGLAKKVFYGERLELKSALSSSPSWMNLSSWDPNGTIPAATAGDQRWETFFSLVSDLDPSALYWDDEGIAFIASPSTLAWNNLRPTLAAGDGGISVEGVSFSAAGSSFEMQTSGDLEIKTSSVAGIGGSSATSSAELRLEAAGDLKIGAPTAAGVAPTATAATEQQVRLEADANSVAPTLAVIRTADSLEMRNVVIRSFDGTRIEKVTRNGDGTSTLNGRVLMSGSAVRDFKIKELVGAAVNADAKIQMMAMDGLGNLAGEMVVQGEMPVAAELAGQLAAKAGTPLGANDASASTRVHAASVDLAARTVNFNQATITAMNAITARANTVIVQNSFMTVVRATGMINMYVQNGAVNMNYGTVRDGYANFAGANTFQFGSVAQSISSQGELNTAYGTFLFDTGNNGGAPVPGAINVLNL